MQDRAATVRTPVGQIHYVRHEGNWAELDCDG